MMFVVYMIFRISTGYSKNVLKTGQFSSQLFTQEGYCLRQVSPKACRFFSASSSVTAPYRSCLELAEQNGVESIAFCCISTGVFHFPNQRAAEIAVETVRKFKAETVSEMKVIFNVFKDLDLEIYRRLLTDG